MKTLIVGNSEYTGEVAWVLEVYHDLPNHEMVVNKIAKTVEERKAYFADHARLHGHAPDDDCLTWESICGVLCSPECPPIEGIRYIAFLNWPITGAVIVKSDGEVKEDVFETE